jgi:glycosyltransferase involved in cell wall biosynthesis
MRIVHVVQRFHPAMGGAETHVREVAREQARRGHEVTVATSAHPGAPDDAMVRDPDGAHYRVRRFAARQFRGDYLLPPWLPMRGLDAFLRDADPDVYHAHSYRFATLEHAARAATATGRPLVVTAHGFYPPENPLVALARLRYDLLRGRRVLRTARRLVAVTRHEVDHYARLGVDPGRVDVVPNGIPAEALLPGDGARFRKQHGLDAGPLVLFLARLGHDKGVEDFVAAAPRVLAHHPKATFALCGRDAGARPAAEKLVQRLGVKDRVRFLGPVDDPRDAYAACDVFCLPSHYEAFGIVYLEAMAQGKPVIGTTAGGIPEVVADAGLLVPPRKPDALAGALARLLEDGMLRRELGRKGRARAEGLLWTHVVDRLEETYGRALGE